MAAVKSVSAADESLRELVDIFEFEIIRHLHTPSHLFQYLDLSIVPMDTRKTIFDHEIRSKERAIRIMLSCLKNCKAPWFRQFKEALRLTGHETLRKMLNLEDVDVQKYDRVYHKYYLKTTSDVNAHEITVQLLSWDILKKEDKEKICATANEHGNSRAMIELTFRLRELNDKWLVHLVAATRECGYLLDHIDPRLEETETFRSMESMINRQAAVINSEKQAAERGAKREPTATAAISRVMRKQTASTVNVTAEPESRLHDHKRLNIDLEDGEFDFRSCYAEQQAGTATSRATCKATAAAAVAAGVHDNAENGREMKTESSCAVNNMSPIRQSQRKDFVREDSVTLSNHHGIPATEVESTLATSSAVCHKNNLFCEIIVTIMHKITEQLSAKCDEELRDDRELAVRRRMAKLANPCERPGSCSYKKIVEKLEEDVQRIFDQNTRDYLWSCLRRLRIYNNALMIDSACRTRDALNYVDDQLSAVRDSRGSMSISDISRLLDNLHSDMEDCLKEISVSPADSNQRLILLEDYILRHVYGEGGGSSSGEDGGIERRGVVLCDSVEVADALLRWMKQESRSLAALKPANLSPSRKSHVKELFGGGHQLLVAVSSDIDDIHLSGCNYTIDYTATGSLLQYDVSLHSTTVDSSLYSGSSACSSTSPNSPVYQLMCVNCHADGTCSSSLRLLKEHCITTDKDFAGRAVYEECIRPKTLQHWEKRDKIKCRKCRVDWGIRANYRGHSYDVLTVVSFEMIAPDASCLGPFKNWNEVPFKIRTIRRKHKSCGQQAQAAIEQ